MSISINSSTSFAPTNNGNGTILEVAEKAKELAEEKGEITLQLIESAAPSSSQGNVGQKINITV